MTNACVIQDISVAARIMVKVHYDGAKRRFGGKLGSALLRGHSVFGRDVRRCLDNPGKLARALLGGQEGLFSHAEGCIRKAAISGVRAATQHAFSSSSNGGNAGISERGKAATDLRKGTKRRERSSGRGRGSGNKRIVFQPHQDINEAVLGDRGPSVQQGRKAIRSKRVASGQPVKRGRASKIGKSHGRITKKQREIQEAMKEFQEQPIGLNG